MRTDFNSVWVVTGWSDQIKEDDVVFFDYDDAIFYCEEKNQEAYNKSNVKDRFVRPFSVQTLYESMRYIIREAEKCSYDEGYESGYESGRDDGYDEGYDSGRREGDS